MPPKKPAAAAAVTNGDEDPKNVSEVVEKVVKKPAAKKVVVKKASSDADDSVKPKKKMPAKAETPAKKDDSVKPKKKVSTKAETPASTGDVKPKSKPKAAKKTEDKKEPEVVKVAVVVATAEPTKPKKKSVPKVVKDLVWSKWIGDDIARHSCMCCEVNIIKMNSFHCGHIVAESNGGATSVENLKPICAACNLSMGTDNFDDFKKRCGFVGGAKKKETVKVDDKPKKEKKPAARKPKAPSVEEVRKEKIKDLLISGKLSLCPGTEQTYNSIGSLFKSSACSNSFMTSFTEHCDRCNNHYHNAFDTKTCPCFSIW